MEKHIIKTYIDNFRRFIYPHLKDNVFMEVVAYPAKDGCLMLFEFNNLKNNDTDIRSKSENIQEAMMRSNIFDKPKEAPAIQGTKMVITHSHLIILKGDKDSNWDSDTAKRDVEKFINALNKR